jgi:hypothetical protein
MRYRDATQIGGGLQSIPMRPCAGFLVVRSGRSYFQEMDHRHRSNGQSYTLRLETSVGLAMIIV